MDTRDITKLETTFDSYIKTSISSFLQNYDMSHIELDKTESFISYTNSFLQQLHPYCDKKLYIIIDEYDHFANAMLTSKQQFIKATDKDGFIRSFYEVLKVHTQYSIDRIFITGVTSLTLDSLTSGFNIAVNVSDYISLNAAIGFTAEEVKTIFETVDIQEIDRTIKLFKENYNGYLFSNMASEQIYNSNMILYYLDTLKNKGRVRNLADPNIVGDYSKLKSMFVYTKTAFKKRVYYRSS